MQGPISFSTTVPRQAEARRLPRSIVLLPALGALILGILVYQLPARSTVAIGSPGDRLFIASSQALDATPDAEGSWYADELGDGGRSRWTRSRARITFAGAGGGDAEVTLRAQGWPTGVSRNEPRQPIVTVRAGGSSPDMVVGQFTPTPEWQEYGFSVPATARASADLVIELQASATFTSTQQFSDARPKGIRVDQITLETARRPGLLPIGWQVVLQLTGAVLLATLAVRRRASAGLATLLGLGLALAGATALALWRPWVALLMPLLPALALAGALVAGRHDLARLGRAARTRLGMSEAVVTAWLVALASVSAYLLVTVLGLAALPAVRGLRNDPERLVRLLPVLVIAGALLAAGPTVLPDWLRSLRRRLLLGRLTPAMLVAAVSIVLGWELRLLRELPFVGHADYADNAVVARNLLRGRGWVVDYVSQFYYLVPGGTVTRPQETWPLLQPLLMLPSMALWGATPFAARVPNILFMAVLTLLIYHIGARAWDRRVGLIAALLTLANVFFFYLAIYATSDLALTVWSMAAFWLVYQATEAMARPGSASAQPARLWPGFGRWIWAGVFTGLMILQKPGAAIFALGMGIWVLWRLFSERRAGPGGRSRESGVFVGSEGQGDKGDEGPPPVSLAPMPPTPLPPRSAPGSRWCSQYVPPLLVWIAITILVVAPYLVRNLQVFGKPFFSTEAFDAWVLYFRGTREEAWEDIYKVYAPELGGPDVPDRSWILRWGYDLTLNKIGQQIRQAFKFFAPPAGELLGIAGTWLMLLGLLTLRRRQRRLVGLVGTALILYTAFLCLYWHTYGEPRYFVPFVPWLALLAAWGACRLFDSVAAVGQGRWAGLGGLIACLALATAVEPHWRAIDAYLDPQSARYWGKNWQADLEAYAWLRQHTAPDAVVMTRVPWQLNFHADRPAVMIPNADGEQIMRIASYYGADYLLVNGSSTSQPERDGALKPLARGTPPPGWQLVHEVPDRYNGAPVRIYRFPPDDARVQETQPGDR